MTIDPNKKYSATFKTSRGEIICDLFAKEAPKTVNNFVFLAKEKFYDGTVFHRVIADFMIQGGDPTATGGGGPGYRFDDEVKNNPRKHQVGSLSMANAGRAARLGVDRGREGGLRGIRRLRRITYSREQRRVARG